MIVILIWGVNFVAAKMGMESFPPLLLAALRFTLVAIPAVFFIKPPGIGWKNVAIIGFVMSTLQFGLLYIGMMLGMPAGLASLVMQVQTVFTVLFAALWLGERPTPGQVAGIGIGLTGMAIVGWQFFAIAPPLPFLLTVGAGLMWGLGNVLTRRRPPRDGFSLVVWSALVAPIPLLAASLIFDGPTRVWTSLAHPSVNGVIGLLFLAYGASMVGYGLWNLLLSRHSAATVSPWSMLVPLVGAVAAYLYNGEVPTPLGIVGGIITLIGVLLALGVGARWLRRGRADDDTPAGLPATEPPGL